MYKGYGVLFLLFLITIFCLRKLFKNHFKLFFKVALGGVVLIIAVNCIYNLRYVYPAFLYEGVPIGDSRENLLVYKDDSQFKEQVLNTVTHNRDILLDSNGKLYKTYFGFYAKSIKMHEVSEEARQCLQNSKSDFDEIGILSMVVQMPYAFPLWENGPQPILYLNKENLKGKTSLVGVVEEREGIPDLYLMSEEYYQNHLAKGKMR